MVGYRVLFDGEILKEGSMEECFAFAHGICECILQFNKRADTMEKTDFVSQMVDLQISVVCVDKE